MSGEECRDGAQDPLDEELKIERPEALEKLTNLGNGSTSVMGLSPEEVGILVAVGDEVTPDQLETILTSCHLQEILTTKDEEEIATFGDLVKKFSDLDRIRHNDLTLVGNLLWEAKRHDLAKKIPNWKAGAREENCENILDDLKRHLQCEYRKAVKLPPNPTSAVSLDVDSVFCNVQLSRNRQRNQDGLREPLGSYIELLARDANHLKSSHVILKGKSASGKTTLLRKITKDWLKGLLPDYELLIFLSVGDLKPHWTIGEAVVNRLLPKNSGITPRQVDDVIRQMEEKVALLFDGYKDSIVKEIDGASANHSSLLIGDILRYRQLRNIFVLIATRSHGAKEFCLCGDSAYRVYQHVELYGFTEEGIEQYVRSSLPDKKQDSLLKYLETNQLKELVRTPGILEMLCHYWNMWKVDTDPPEMLTTLFHNMIFGLHRHTIVQSPHHNDIVPQEGGKCSFPMIVSRLGKRAFDLLVKEERVFTLEELKQGASNEECRVIDDCIKLGILKFEDSVYQDISRRFVFDEGGLGSLKARLPEINDDDDDGEDSQDLCRSPVSSVQELVSFHSDHVHGYCAALHLRKCAKSNFPKFEKKVKKLMKSFPKVIKMKCVFMLCFADVSVNNSERDVELNVKIGQFLLKQLNRIMNEAIKSLEEIPNEKTEIRIFELRNHFTKLCLHCNYEAQVGSSLNKEMGNCLGEGIINLVGVSEYTTRALSYFLKHSMARKSPRPVPVDEVFELNSMKIISLGSEVSMPHKKEFSKHISGGVTFFRCLMSEYIDCCPNELRNLRDLIEKQFGKVQYSRDLCEVKKVALLHYYQRFKKLHPHTDVLLPSIQAIIESRQSSNITELSLVIPNVEKEVWTRLFDAFTEGLFQSLMKLDLSFCGLSPDLLRLLSKSFKPPGLLPKLEVLLLAGNECTKDILQKIKHLKNLKEIGLQRCGLSSRNLDTLMQSLYHLRSLERIDIRRNEFSDQNVGDFKNLLSKFGLKSLKLSLIGMRKNIRSLVSSIKKQRALEVLHLNHCPEFLVLLSCCRDIPLYMPNLSDFRMSAPLPNFEGAGLPSLPKLKLSEETLQAFTTSLRKSRLETFSILYCDLDEESFVQLFRACNFLKNHHCFKLMRYSYLAMKKERENPGLDRILSWENSEEILQLW